MDIFEKATKLRLQFEYKGVIGVEDLWELNQGELNSIYKKLNSLKKDSSEDGLMQTRSSQDELLDLKMEIVKRVFEVKKEEAEHKKSLAEKKAKKEFLMGVLEKRQNDELMQKTPEEIKAMLDELG